MKMKIKLLIAVLIFNAAFLFAKDHPIEKIFAKYEGKKGFETVKVTEDLMDTFAGMSKKKNKNKKDKAAMDFLGGIKSIRILNYENEGSSGKINLYDEVLSAISVKEYQELISVISDDSKLKILVKKDEKNKEVFKEFLFINEEDGGEEATLIWIDGDLNLNNLMELSNEFGGMDFNNMNLGMEKGNNSGIENDKSSEEEKGEAEEQDDE